MTVITKLNGSIELDEDDVLGVLMQAFFPDDLDDLIATRRESIAEKKEKIFFKKTDIKIFGKELTLQIKFDGDR